MVLLFSFFLSLEAEAGYHYADQAVIKLSHSQAGFELITLTSEPPEF